MSPTNPQVVIHQVEGNPVGAERQWAWLMRVLRATEPTPPAPPARDEQPAAPRTG